MTDADELRHDLAAARDELLEALAGITQDELARPLLELDGAEGQCVPMRGALWDTLWGVGQLDDWTRRVIDQARGGRALDVYEARRRPVHMETPELLRQWLEQTRRATLVLLEKLSADDLERELTLPGGEVRTPRSLLAHLVNHDREQAALVRATRAME